MGRLLSRRPTFAHPVRQVGAAGGVSENIMNLRRKWDREGHRVLIRVWVDWHDYAPLRDGLPDAHYRFQIRHGDAALSGDARAANPEEAERVIREGFGWR
jgi:hypothetical protein